MTSKSLIESISDASRGIAWGLANEFFVLFLFIEVIAMTLGWC